jgi:NADH-quinone oxidoreductase subunit K
MIGCALFPCAQKRNEFLLTIVREDIDAFFVSLLDSCAIIFSLSVVGIFLNRKNLIVLLMAIELMLLGGQSELHRVFPLSWGCSRSDFCFFILTVAAAESAIGLAILVACSVICGRFTSMTWIVSRDKEAFR